MKKKDTNGTKDNLTAPSRKIIMRAMELWQIYGASYSTCLNSYTALLQRKRDLKIRPLGKLPEGVLREFPEISFLKIREPSEAEAYLRKLDDVSARRLIDHIEYVVEYDYSYRTVTNRVKEFEYQVKYHGQKNPYAMDPGFVNGHKGYKGLSGGRNRRIDEAK